MTDVVEQCGSDCISLDVGGNLQAILTEPQNEVAHDPHRAHAVTKSRVLGAMISKPRRSQLQDSPESLEFRRVNQGSKEFPLSRTDYNVSVNRIPKDSASRSPSFDL